MYMFRALFLPVGLSVALVTAAVSEEPMAANRLVGTWKFVSGRYKGQVIQRAPGLTHIKHVTPTHFMWAVYDTDGRVIVALGGSCTLKGDEYTETPEYGLGAALNQVKEGRQVFSVRLEGNRWFHTGTSSTGLMIDEVWERVEPK